MAAHDVIYERVGAHSVLVLVPRRAPPHAVLTFLHGKGEAAGDEEGRALGSEAAQAVLCRHGPPALAALPPAGEPDKGAAEALEALARFLIICPQLPRIRQWQEADARWLVPIEDRLVGAHSGDMARHHLTGFSWGGGGVTRFARRADLAGRWRRLWPVDPRPDVEVTPLPPRSLPTMLHFGTYFDQGAMEDWRRRAGFKGNFRVGAMRAEKDLAVGHIETAREAYLDPHAYRWLAAWESKAKVERSS
jgi:hypothetical protein